MIEYDSIMIYLSYAGGWFSLHIRPLARHNNKLLRYNAFSSDVKPEQRNFINNFVYIATPGKWVERVYNT